MSSSQPIRAAAQSPGPGTPRFLTSMRASRTACSVSSVMAPAGRPAAIGWPGGAGSKPVSSGPQRAVICRRDNSWVGMPRASPIARPYNAPLAWSAADTKFSPPWKKLPYARVMLPKQEGSLT